MTIKMIRKKPVIVDIKRIYVDSEHILLCKVIKSGNGATIPFFKKYTDKEVYVIIKDKVIV